MIAIFIYNNLSNGYHYYEKEITNRFTYSFLCFCSLWNDHTHDEGKKSYKLINCFPYEITKFSVFDLLVCVCTVKFYYHFCLFLSSFILISSSLSSSFHHFYHPHYYHFYHPHHYHLHRLHRLHRLHLIFFPNWFTVDDSVFLRMNHMIYSIASHTLLLWSALISKFHSLFLFQFFLPFILRWFIRSHEAQYLLLFCWCPLLT